MAESQRTSSPTVRDDPTGALSARLRLLSACGTELLSSVRIVASAAEFDQWRALREDWRQRCAQAIAAAFEREAAEEFVYASRAIEDGSDWSAALTNAKRGVAQGVEVLDSLSNTLSRSAVPARGSKGRQREEVVCPNTLDPCP